MKLTVCSNSSPSMNTRLMPVPLCMSVLWIGFDWPSLWVSSLMGSPLSCIRLPYVSLSFVAVSSGPLSLGKPKHQPEANLVNTMRIQSFSFIFQKSGEYRMQRNIQWNIQWNMQLNMQIAEVYASLCKKGTSSLRSQSSCGISTAWASSPRRFELRIAKFGPGKVWKGFRREF